MRTRPRLVWAALLTVYVVWGSTYFAIRHALVSFPPFLQIGSRFALAGALLLAFLRARRTPWPTAREWRDGAVVGILLLGCGTGVVAYAEQTVSSSLTAVFLSVSPVLFALWSGLLGSWPRPAEWVGIGVGMVGVALLASGSTLSGQPVGLAALAVAVACWSLGSVLSQRKLRLAPGAMGFASEMVCGGAFLLLLAAARGERMAWPPQASAVVAWVYLVTVGSLLAFSAYMYLLARVPPALASSYAFVNPAIAVALGVGLGGERVTAREAVAMAVVLLAVVVLTQGSRRGEAPAARAGADADADAEA